MTLAGHAKALVGGIVSIFVTGVLVAAVSHFGEIASFAAMLHHAQPFWLAVALILQAATYTSVSLGWRAVLLAGGSPLRLRQLLPIAISKLFADQVIPVAGMGGNMLLIDWLVAMGAPRGVAVAVLLVSMIGFYAAYALLALAMLIMLWVHGDATVWMVAFVGIFLLVALAIPSFALWLRQRGTHPLAPMIERLSLVHSLLKIVGEAPADLIADRRLILRVAAFNGLVFLADAATLAVCFRALGAPVPYQICFIAVMTASMIATLGPIPLGLGSFEAGSTGMLTIMGVPLEAALTATLLLRAFSLWLPLLPGLVMMRGFFRRRGQSAPMAA